MGSKKSKSISFISKGFVNSIFSTTKVNIWSEGQKPGLPLVHILFYLLPFSLCQTQTSVKKQKSQVITHGKGSGLCNHERQEGVHRANF